MISRWGGALWEEGDMGSAGEGAVALKKSTSNVFLENYFQLGGTTGGKRNAVGEKEGAVALKKSQIKFVL